MELGSLWNLQSSLANATLLAYWVCYRYQDHLTVSVFSRNIVSQYSSVLKLLCDSMTKNMRLEVQVQVTCFIGIDRRNSVCSCIFRRKERRNIQEKQM